MTPLFMGLGGQELIIILIITFSLCFLAVPFIESVPWLSGRWKTASTDK